jgi:DNA-binding NtrC family response regulator
VSLEQSILVIDDEAEIGEALKIVLEGEGYEVATETDSVAAIERICEREFAVVITDIRMSGADGYRVIEETRRRWPDTQVIVITSYGSVESAVRAMQIGAANYINKPFVHEELRLAVRRALESRALTLENRRLREEVVSARIDTGKLVGNSAPMRRVLDQVQRIAPSRANVFISGPSGAGKGLLGRVIHANSPRTSKPFITINCGAIPEALLESELFGHKKGAFTNAYEHKDGLFKVADGGTVMLDEIAEMAPRLQVKLLHAIQEHEFTPMGWTKPVKVDIRILATTNRDVPEALAEGRLREDLYYRLNVFEIEMPSLAERADDIPLLVHHQIRRVNDETGANVPGVDQEALRCLAAYGWPGNVRELQNVVERAVTLALDRTIELRDLPDRLTEAVRGGDDLQRSDMRLRESVKRFERELIVRALKLHEGDKEAAAESMQIDLATLYRKLDHLGIDKRTGRGEPKEA